MDSGLLDQQFGRISDWPKSEYLKRKRVIFRGHCVHRLATLALGVQATRHRRPRATSLVPRSCSRPPHTQSCNVFINIGIGYLNTGSIWPSDALLESYEHSYFWLFPVVIVLENDHFQKQENAI